MDNSELLNQVKAWIIREASTNSIKDKFLKDCENSFKSAALATNKSISSDSIENLLNDAENLYEIVLSILHHVDIEQIKGEEITYH